jgi:hypothetical protein
MNFRLFILVLLLVILNACSPRIKIGQLNQESPELKTIKFEAKGIYPKPVIKYFIKKIKTPDKIKITSGIELYKISYYTKDEKNKRILVSGLLAFPRNKKIKGIVSYQHGTNHDRNNAPSQPSQDEGLAIAAIFAGGGYICMAPDYIGFGISNEIHTYLHVETTVNAVVDFLKVGSEICTVLTGNTINNLFLIGMSQGGHATAAVHRYIELHPINGLNLVASSAISGAYNLKEISIPYAIEYNSVFYLGYLANSYCHIYQKPIGSVVSALYVTAVSEVFDGDHSFDQIKKRLPKTADSLYTKEILNDFRLNKSDWFTDRLAENQTFDWKPVAIFRMYYGSNDKDVSPKDAISANARMKQLGGNVQLIGLGNLDHLQSAYSGIPKTRAFFDSLSYEIQYRSKIHESPGVYSPK